MVPPGKRVRASTRVCFVSRSWTTTRLGSTSAPTRSCPRRRPGAGGTRPPGGGWSPDDDSLVGHDRSVNLVERHVLVAVGVSRPFRTHGGGVVHLGDVDPATTSKVVAVAHVEVPGRILLVTPIFECARLDVVDDAVVDVAVVVVNRGDEPRHVVARLPFPEFRI